MNDVLPRRAASMARRRVLLRVCGRRVRVAAVLFIGSRLVDLGGALRGLLCEIGAEVEFLRDAFEAESLKARAAGRGDNGSGGSRWCI